MNGLLVINLGTPSAPTPPAVRTYLREFLSDPRVLDIHPVGRAALLNLVILPTRPKKSAEAYQKIWTDRGSPLLFHSQDLTDKVRARMGSEWKVELAMRYGQPSIPEALERFRAAGISRLVVMPMFPQYAASSTGSALEVVYRYVASAWNTPYLHVVPPYYDDPLFIDAFAEVGRPVLDDSKPDHVLFSFHGLPERHMVKSDPTGRHCLASTSCCDAIGPENAECYRAQCFATARALAARLELPAGGWEVTFQSRLGRTPWIRPYTDEVLLELPKRGIKKLAVFCPAFVADCLETLEEIGMRAEEDFRAAGGDALTLVPSLNSSDAWANAVVALAERALAAAGAQREAS